MSDNYAVNAEELSSFVARLDALEQERIAVMNDFRVVFSEAKAAGYPPKQLRVLVKERAMPEEDRQTHYFLLNAYRKALDMLAEMTSPEAIERAVQPTRRGRPPGRPQPITVPSYEQQPGSAA